MGATPSRTRMKWDSVGMSPMSVLFFAKMSSKSCSESGNSLMAGSGTAEVLGSVTACAGSANCTTSSEPSMT